MTPIRIGTRRSQLALWQTHFIRDQLLHFHPESAVEIIHFTTQGDRVLDKPLPEIGGKGVFTQELEAALERGEIDLAVHSLKDLPTRLPDGFIVGAIPERASPFDVLVSQGKVALDALPSGAVIGTSSLRRAAQLKAYRPDLQTLPIRGNVETRIHKALDPQGDYHATILAAAGLERLERGEVITHPIDTAIMLPAPGQGAIAVQCRAADTTILDLLQPLDHLETRLCVTAERAFLRHLEAGCTLPVSAYAVISGETLTLTGRVNSLDGQKTITVEGQAAKAEGEALGIALAGDALNQGAAGLLSEIIAAGKGR